MAGTAHERAAGESGVRAARRRRARRTGGQPRMSTRDRRHAGPARGRDRRQHGHRRERPAARLAHRPGRRPAALQRDRPRRERRRDDHDPASAPDGQRDGAARLHPGRAVPRRVRGPAGPAPGRPEPRVLAGDLRLPPPHDPGAGAAFGAILRRDPAASGVRRGHRRSRADEGLRGPRPGGPSALRRRVLAGRRRGEPRGQHRPAR